MLFAIWSSNFFTGTSGSFQTNGNRQTICKPFNDEMADEYRHGKNVKRSSYDQI
jgi:hypothetical protein